MATRRCLGRLIERGGRGFVKLESSRSYYAAAAAAPPTHVGVYFNYNSSSSFSSFNSFSFHRWIHSSENPTSTFNNKVVLKDGGGPLTNQNYTPHWKDPDDDSLIGIKTGEFVNLSDLLFTETRDYLIKCNDGRRVKAAELAGKVVVIYFDSLSDMDTYFLTFFMSIYTKLQHNSGFEVVFVNVDDAVDGFNGELSVFPSQDGPQTHFGDIISRMPWTAIPLSDITSRKRLKTRFGVPERLSIGTPVVVDSTGMILQSHAYSYFLNYGAPGYPFSDERIGLLASEDDAAARQPSLKNLLASPERDYLISNKGDKVPIRTLEDKVVALYFYNEQHFSNVEFTLELKGVYEELAKNNEKFEVVLIYIYDTPSIQTKESFWKLFEYMPWLALPIGDSNYKKLERIFFFPWDSDIYGNDMRLIVLGPHMEFIEPFGSDILEHFKIPAYPFSREKAAMLAAEEAKKLKLEMLWDPNSVFAGKYESQVSFSQLVGKKVIIFFDKGELQKWEAESLETLKDRYIQKKGTNDEFEVIHVTALSSKTEHVANLPWFVQTRGRDDKLFNLCGFKISLLAFDRNGSLVRIAVHPAFKDSNFPFYAGGLEKEVLSQLVNLYGWDRYEDGCPGMIFSYKKEHDKSI